jgi:hypothetical protein
MSRPKRLRPEPEPIIVEPLHPGPCTTSDGKQPPFEVGRQAGAAVRRLLANRADHITTSVEWYRGFCAACEKQPDPKVEAFIAKEIRQVAAGADARHPVTIVATAMASAHVADITEVLERRDDKP